MQGLKCKKRHEFLARLLIPWHTCLSMSRYSEQWHIQDMQDEIEELQDANLKFDIWSELSDVVYTWSRAYWSGYLFPIQLPYWQILSGIVYMIPKYSLRFLFFKNAGRKLNITMQEVRNPRKNEKLYVIATRYGIDPDVFMDICKKQLKYWPLLK